MGRRRRGIYRSSGLKVFNDNDDAAAAVHGVPEAP